MELLYYVYCIEMHRSEEEFFKSSLAKVIRMIDIKANGVQKREKDIICEDMTDFLA